MVFGLYVHWLVVGHHQLHGLRTPGEEITFTARSKRKSQSQIYRCRRSIFCLPHRPKISGSFDLCLHWVFVVCDQLDELCAINQLFDGDDETRKMRLSNCSEKRPRPSEQTQFTNFMIKTQGCQCTNSS